MRPVANSSAGVGAAGGGFRTAMSWTARGTSTSWPSTAVAATANRTPRVHSGRRSGSTAVVAGEGGSAGAGSAAIRPAAETSGLARSAVETAEGTLRLPVEPGRRPAVTAGTAGRSEIRGSSPRSGKPGSRPGRTTASAADWTPSSSRIFVTCCASSGRNWQRGKRITQENQRPHDQYRAAAVFTRVAIVSWRHSGEWS